MLPFFPTSLIFVKRAYCTSTATRNPLKTQKYTLKHLNSRNTGRIRVPCPVFCSECRGFPPVAGLSYSCWFQINRFSSACDSHPIRLLSVVRHMSRAEQQYVCLSVSFSAYDGCLVISTEEEAFTFLGGWGSVKRVGKTLSLCIS